MTQKKRDVIDLDEYRRQREDEGTWPPADNDTVEYWREQKRKNKLPSGGDGDGPGYSASGMLEGILFPDAVRDDIHPI